MSGTSRKRRFAEAIARKYRRALRHVRAACEWHYWDWVEGGEPGHGAVEDTSHGHIDVGLASEARRRGAVFTDAALRRVARTLLDMMRYGDLCSPQIAPASTPAMAMPACSPTRST